MISLTNGKLASLTRAEYDATPGTNWSTFKHIDKSPAHCREIMVTPQEDTDAKKRGRASHAAILEPGLFVKTHAIWDGARRAGNVWKEFQGANKGRDILTADEHARCRAISTAVRNHPTAGPYLAGGQSELAVLFDYVVAPINEFPGYTERCKGRIDFVSKRDVILDVKTTRDASPRGFGGECSKYLYAAQAAFYRDGYEAATGKRLPYWLVACETEPPFAVQVYVLTERVLEHGRNKYRTLLDTFVSCRADNHWPAYGEGTLELELPSWDMPREQDDISDLGITFNQQQEHA